MALPVLSVRAIPLAVRLDCGYQSVIVFKGRENLAIFEKTVQPPSPDGGDKIKTSTMLNVNYETSAPQRLLGFDDAVVVAAYDPHVMSILDTLVNLQDSITFAYPEGSAEVYWGYLQKVAKSPLQKDQQPEMTLTIVITNWDPVNCVEAGPIFVNGTGSCGFYTGMGVLGDPLAGPLEGLHNY